MLLVASDTEARSLWAAMESDAQGESAGRVSEHSSYSVHRGPLKVLDVHSLTSTKQNDQTPKLNLTAHTSSIKRNLEVSENYRGISPKGTLAAVAAGSTRRAGVLTEVVVASNGLSAEVAHETATAARHPVAAL